MRWPLWTMIAGAALFIIGVAAHNVMSAAYRAEEPVFFYIATIISPLVFAAGFAGYIIQAISRKR